MDITGNFPPDRGGRALPLVTIVTPAYNQATFLRATIESVLAQTYPALEYIVIDDGSTDATLEVLSAYEGKFRFLSQENRGQAATLNRGWALARGAIIGYLSADDLLMPEAVSTLVAALLRDDSVAAAYCDFDLIDYGGALIRPVQTEEFERRRLVEDLVCQPGPGALFRRSAFIAVGGWNEQLRQIPDFEFWTRVAQKGDLVRVPQRLAGCRVHEESASYRRLSAERSDEILKLVRSDAYPVDGRGLRRATGAALLISAKRHLSAGRFATGGGRLLRAFATRPKLLIRAGTWRMMASALLRRALFSSRARPTTKAVSQ